MKKFRATVSAIALGCVAVIAADQVAVYQAKADDKPAVCTPAPREVETLELQHCQGNYNGFMCCAYGPNEAGCYGVLCRSACEEEWEPTNMYCPPE